MKNMINHILGKVEKSFAAERQAAGAQQVDEDDEE
jgi:hypothetical protein